MSWHCLSASVSFVEPAITLEKSWVQRLPTSWNCGMPTYCTPGSPGRLVVPGLLIGAAFIAASVVFANAFAAAWYCGSLYVEKRVPGGIEAQPPLVFVPAALMYWALVAHEMYFQASAESGELFGIARAQLHNHPDAFVLSTGAKAKPFLPRTGLSFASSRPAATVASYHIATLPAWYCARHSLKLEFAASFSPAFCTRPA